MLGVSSFTDLSSGVKPVESRCPVQTYEIEALYSNEGASARIVQGDEAMQVLIQAHNDNDAIVQGCRLGMRFRDELKKDSQFLKRLTVTRRPLPRVDVDGFLFNEAPKPFFQWDCDAQTTLQLELERATGQAMPAFQAAA